MLGHNGQALWYTPWGVHLFMASSSVYAGSAGSSTVSCPFVIAQRGAVLALLLLYSFEKTLPPPILSYWFCIYVYNFYVFKICKVCMVFKFQLLHLCWCVLSYGVLVGLYYVHYMFCVFSFSMGLLCVCSFMFSVNCFWGLESRAYLCPPFLGSLFPFLTVVFMPCLSGINFPGYAKPPFLFLPLKQLFKFYQYLNQ